MAFNKVILMGNLTRDPELRSTTSGSSVTSFALAVNRTWNNAQGERQEETSFLLIVKLSELAKLSLNMSERPSIACQRTTSTRYLAGQRYWQKPK